MVQNVQVSNSAKIAQNRLLTAVKDIEIGSRIELESGEVVKINSITKGWLHNSRFLNYSNGGWSCLLNSDRVVLYGS